MKTKLLLVEDEDRLAAVLKTFFEKKNFDVEFVSDGEDALFEAEGLKPDIILQDRMLPNMSGLEICRQIRSTKDLKNTPIIILTAKGEEEDKLRRLDIGADDYITKPFSQKILLCKSNDPKSGYRINNLVYSSDIPRKPINKARSKPIVI